VLHFIFELAYKDRPEKLEVIQSLIPSTQYVKKELTKKTPDNSYKYEGYEQSLVTSLLLGDFSVHSGNMGVIGRENDEKKKLVRIDFGAAFRDFQDDINPYKTVKNRVGLEKNYFLRDHPKERIISKEFANELRKVGSEDLTPVIEEKWENITKNFDAKAINAFGIQLGVPETGINPDKIKEHFAAKLALRQESLKNIATEIDISLAIKNKDLGLIQDIVRANPKHCQHIVDNPKETQLREKYSKSTLQLLKTALEKSKEEVLTTAVPNKPEGNSVDNIIFPSPQEVKVKSPDTQKPEHSQITQFIREEIIAKQVDIIKNVVGESNPEIDKLTKEQFADYLKNPANKKAVHEALEVPTVKKAFEKEIHQTEVAAHKKFNEQFKDELKPIAWDGAVAADTKSQVVKNAQGQEICTLTEKTVKSSESFSLANGETKEIASYRTIDFPLSIKAGSGPMHVSMALKDQNGQNMKASEAVCFTAHYDKSGKLTEVSAPQPVKFMGDNPDAPGYIERDGKIFTLPVTQGKYQEMMKEVSKNQGMAVDISQKIDTLAKDTAVTKDLEVPKVEKVNKLDITSLPKEDLQKLSQIRQSMRSKSLPPPSHSSSSELPINKQKTRESEGRG